MGRSSSSSPLMARRGSIPQRVHTSPAAAPAGNCFIAAVTMVISYKASRCLLAAPQQRPGAEDSPHRCSSSTSLQGGSTCCHSYSFRGADPPDATRGHLEAITFIKWRVPHVCGEEICPDFPVRPHEIQSSEHIGNVFCDHGQDVALV